MLRILTIFLIFVLHTSCDFSEKNVATKNNSNLIIKSLDANEFDNTKNSTIFELIIAETSIHNNDITTGLSYYNKIIKKYPNNLYIIKRISQLAHKEKQAQIALKYFKLWEKKEPNNIFIKQFILINLLRLEQYQIAISYWNKVLPASKNPSILLIQMIKKHVAITKISNSLQYMLQKNGENNHLLFLMAWISHEQNKYLETITYVDKLLNKNQYHKQLIDLKINSLLKTQGTIATTKYLQQYIKKYPQDLKMRFLLIKFLIEVNKKKQALQQLKQVQMHQKNNNPNILLNISLILIDLKKYIEAKHYLSKLSKHKKYYNLIQFYLGFIAEKQQKLNTALNYYRQVNKDSPKKIESQLKIVKILVLQNKWQEANQLFQQQLKQIIEPEKKIYAIVTYVTLLQKYNKFKQALDLLNNGLSKFPDSSDLLYSRSMVYERLNNIKQAEADLRVILKQQPNNPNILNALGYILADKTENYQEALKYIQQAIKQQPDNAAFIDSLGWVKYKLNEFKESIQLLNKSLSLMPDNNDEIRAHLIIVLWKDGQLQKAKKLWQDSIKKYPNSRFLDKIPQQWFN